MVIRVLLVDDHEMFRNGVAALLKGEADIKVIGEAADGLELLKLAQETDPDVVCMDIGMPKLDGIEATRDLLALLPKVRIIAVSALLDKGYIRDMLNAGAVGYIAKVSAGENLRRAIRTVQQGKTYLCSGALEVITDSMRVAANGSVKANEELGGRERQVLQLIAKGYKSAEIATRLEIAASTVDAHRRNIMQKLQLHGIAELTRYAIRHGFVTPEE
jgi:DNA-binding NarL/FixJ family response regulator